MFPGPTELLLIGPFDQNQYGPQTPNQIHRHQKPFRRHANEKEISHLTNGIIFCVWSTLAISVPQFVLKRCQKEYKKNHVKKESQRSQDQWWVWLQGLPRIPHLRHQKAWEREAMKVGVLGVRKLWNMIERSDPLFAVTQVTCKTTTTKDPLKVRTHSASYSERDDDIAWPAQGVENWRIDGW